MACWGGWGVGVMGSTETEIFGSNLVWVQKQKKYSKQNVKISNSLICIWNSDAHMHQITPETCGFKNGIKTIKCTVLWQIISINDKSLKIFTTYVMENRCLSFLIHYLDTVLYEIKVSFQTLFKYNNIISKASKKEKKKKEDPELGRKLCTTSDPGLTVSCSPLFILFLSFSNICFANSMAHIF